MQALAALAPTEAYDLTQDGLISIIDAYNVLVLRLGLRVDGEVLAAGKRLRIIATPTTGLDHIDVIAAEKRGINIFSLQGERQFLEQVYATAEHTFALLLALIRHIPAAFDAVKRYEWRRDIFRGTELNGKTLGILGCGRLGSMVARFGIAFGMRVLSYDPYRSDLPAGVVRCLSLEELLTRSDILSVHVPLNADTKNMLSMAELNLLPPGALLLNTSRGGILDESAVLHLLESGHLAGVALDVLEGEYHLAFVRNHPLIEYARAHDNLLITPHIAGATQESVEKADLFIVDKIRNNLSTL